MNGIKYFSHSSNARYDEKIIALRMQYGVEGYGIYFMLLERLSETDDLTCTTEYDKLAYDFHCETAKVKAVVNDFGLFQLTDDGTRFYSPKFIQRQNEQIEKAHFISQKRREAIQKRWAKAKEKQLAENQAEPNTNNANEDTNVSSKSYKSNTNVSIEDTNELHLNENSIQTDTIINKTKLKQNETLLDVSDKSNTSLSESANALSDDELVVCERTKQKEIISYSQILEFWNTQTKGIFNSITCITGKRRESVKARIRQHGKEAFMLAVQKAVKSSFLQGQNARSWQLTFDWLIKPNNFQKVLEGNYDNTTNNSANPRPAEHHQPSAPNYEDTF